MSWGVFSRGGVLGGVLLGVPGGERGVQIRSAKQHFFYGVYGTFGGKNEGWEGGESYIGGGSKKGLFLVFFWVPEALFPTF